MTPERRDPTLARRIQQYLDDCEAFGWRKAPQAWLKALRAGRNPPAPKAQRRVHPTQRRPKRDARRA